MDDKIFIKDGKEIIGINNIVISEAENKIYINNSSQVEESVKGSLAVYFADGTSTLIGSGHECVWDKDTATLEVNTITVGTLLSDKIISPLVEVGTLLSDKIESPFVKFNKIIAGSIETLSIDSNAVNTESIDSEFIISKKIAAAKWLGFKSKTHPDEYPFKFFVRENINKKEALLLTSNKYSEDVEPTVLMSFEDTRVSFKGKTNIESRTINSSIGEITDCRGDIAIDDNFIYYCIKDFDGITKIWKRCSLSTW